MLTWSSTARTCRTPTCRSKAPGLCSSSVVPKGGAGGRHPCTSSPSWGSWGSTWPCSPCTPSVLPRPAHPLTWTWHEQVAVQAQSPRKPFSPRIRWHECQPRVWPQPGICALSPGKGEHSPVRGRRGQPGTVLPPGCPKNRNVLSWFWRPFAQIQGVTGSQPHPSAAACCPRPGVFPLSVFCVHTSPFVRTLVILDSVSFQLNRL